MAGVLNEALCLALSCPAPRQLFCGTIVPPSQTREYYLSLALLGEGRRSLGDPSPPSPCSVPSGPRPLWLCPDIEPPTSKEVILNKCQEYKVRVHS